MNRLQLASLAANIARNGALAGLSARTGHAFHKPARVAFELSTTCNLRCVFCEVWTRKRDPRALKLEEWVRVLRELRGWIGPFALTFTSGEPYTEPDFLPLVREASSLGVLTVCSTNATLITPKKARETAEAGLGTLVASLDGATAETHDFGRGVAGTYAKAIAAIRLVRAQPGAPRVRIASVLSGRNAHEAAAQVRWAAAEGLDGVVFQALRKEGPAWEKAWPEEPALMDRTIDELLALKRDGWPVLNAEPQLEEMKRHFRSPEAPHPELRCGTFASLSIKRDGAVHLCGYMEPVGNARESPVRDLWESEAARQRRREILDCKKPCILMNCNARPGLGARTAEFLRQWSVSK